jgi:hypothetical protein
LVFVKGTEVARWIATGRLDEDDISPHVSEQLAGQQPFVVREVEDAYPWQELQRRCDKCLTKSFLA